MDNQEIRAALVSHWELGAVDIDKSHVIYHDDIIVEFPQSGEQFSGKHNITEFRKHYPAKVGFKILRMRGEGSLWVSEYIVTYDGGRPLNAVNIMEFRDGKVARET